MPEWLTNGKTVLIVKDKDKSNKVTNFRPITCLPIMRKLLTGIISEETYKNLDEEKLLPDEQKGCRRQKRGTKDQLLIDKMVIRKCRRRLTNVAMWWIDYNKACDMIPHSWILKCLKMFGIASNITALMEKAVEKWNVDLVARNDKLGNVRIRRGVFQGDSLPPLLSVLVLIPLTIILRKMKAGTSLVRKGHP